MARIGNDLTQGRQKLHDRRQREAIVLAALEAVAGGLAWAPVEEVRRSIAAALSLVPSARQRRIEQCAHDALPS